jgi:hypothetical protein
MMVMDGAAGGGAHCPLTGNRHDGSLRMGDDDSRLAHRNSRQHGEREDAAPVWACRADHRWAIMDQDSEGEV